MVSVEHMAIEYEDMGKNIQWFILENVEFPDLAELPEPMFKSTVFTVPFEGNVDPVLQGQ
jgi:hypoxanthine phosphoribosyltransferase